jgi:DNA-binding MarR family transcriptional regulator
MVTTTEMLIYEMALRVRLFRMFMGVENILGELTEREILILELLSLRDSMSISEIAELCPTVSGSTISTTITKLWRDDKLVSKTILPENQRVTMVSLTDEGRRMVGEIKRAKAQLYSTVAQSLDLSPEEEGIFQNILTKAIAFFDERINTG